jgi:hypothetical protein
MRRLANVLRVGAIAALSAASGGFAPATPPPVPVIQGYAFPTGAGILFFHVRPDKTTDFEAVVARVGSALDHTQDPARKEQGAGWRIYKSTEAAADAAIYLFFFDPAVKGADYDPVKLLGESVPAEAQGLYDRLKSSLIRVERMGLSKMR